MEIVILSHKLLAGVCKFARPILQSGIHICIAHNLSTVSQPHLEEIVVELIETWVRRHFQYVCVRSTESCPIKPGRGRIISIQMST